MLNHMLVPLDGSSVAECVLPHTIALASAFKANITLLRVLEQAEQTHSVDPLDWHITKTAASTYLDRIESRLRESDLDVNQELLEGRAAELIVEYAQTHSPDLIMLSTHGKSGVSEWNISSVVQKVILHAGHSVMLVRAQNQPVDSKPQHYERILVALDGSVRAEYVLPWANVLANHFNAELILAHVVSKPELPYHNPLAQEDLELVGRIVQRGQEEAEKYLEQVKSGISANTQTRLLVSDNPPLTLHELVEQDKIDLVILSAHGYSGQPRWPYGSLTTSFILYGTSPVLILQDFPAEKTEATQSGSAVRVTDPKVL